MCEARTLGAEKVMDHGAGGNNAHPRQSVLISGRCAIVSTASAMSTSFATVGTGYPLLFLVDLVDKAEYLNRVAIELLCVIL